MPFRTFVFWVHLAVGVLAGLVVLVMCVTGVALAFEKQAVEWADRRAMPATAGGGPMLPPETLLQRVAATGVAPAGLTERADAHAPVLVAASEGRTLIVDGATGAVLGESAPQLRAFFRSMTAWHRWLAMEGASRPTARAITGAANLGFLFIVVSGLYIWMPRDWTWTRISQLAWFRRGLSPKARDFNWHHVIGLWSAIPLAIVVAGAVPISYPWASDLVYRMAGEEPPARPGGPPPGGPAPAGGPRGGERGGPQGGGPRGGERGGRGERGRGERERPDPAALFAGLDAAWAQAKSHHADWRILSVRVTSAEAPFAIAIDDGTGGQPQKRGTLTVDRATGAVRGWESFADLSAGRQARSWLRFAHTGEYYGLAGQAIAGLVSAGGAVLVYTGLALAWRRLTAWLRRRARAVEPSRAVSDPVNG